jgi:hypothetical protein
MMAEDLRVLFIIGKGRSGSTILGDVLGSISGVFHAGELWRPPGQERAGSVLWDEGLSGAYTCSCGEPVTRCPVWTRVVEYVAGDDLGRQAVANPSIPVSLQQRLFTFSGFARSLLRPGRRHRDIATGRRLMTLVYEGIAAATGARLIVDGSKWPLNPLLLDPTDAVRSYGIHLTRDPRDVATSWQKTKYWPDTSEAMPTYGTLYTAASWSARNLASEWTRHRIGERMLWVRYEDFAASPQATVKQILEHVEFTGSADVVDADGFVNIGPGHTMMGNPSRFDRGRIEISPRDSARVPGRALSLLTYPLRRRYGYTN